MRHYTKPATRLLITRNTRYDYWTIVEWHERIQTYVRRANEIGFVIARLAQWADAGPIYIRSING